jgi:hypothetical protein
MVASARGIRAGAAYVELFADDSQLIRGLSRASRRLKAFGAGVQAIGAGISGVGMRMAGLGAAMITPLLGAARVFSEMGDTLAKMSARTGISVEALSELGFVAHQSGSDLESLEIGVKRMQKAIAGAATGSKEATAMLAHLGLTVADLSSLSPEEQFKLIADRISKIDNPTMRAAAALQLFGRSGTNLLPVINRGAAGIEALQEEARRLGLTISTTDAKAAEVFHNTLNALWQTVKRGVFAVGAELAPTLKDLATWVTDLVVRGTAWIKVNRGLIVAVLKIAAVVVTAGVALVVLGYAVSTIGAIFTGLGAIVAGIGTALSLLGTVLGFILSPLGLVITGAAALGAYLVWASGAGGKALAWLGEMFGVLKADAEKLGKGILDALAAGDINLAAELVWLTLKLWWKRGVLWLKSEWLEWKKDFLVVSAEGWAGVATQWLLGTNDLAKVWAETWATIKTCAVVGWGFLGRGFLELSKNMAISWILLQQSLGKMTEKEAAEQRAFIETQYAQLSKEVFVTPVDKAIATIDADLKKDLAKIQAERTQPAAIILSKELADVAAAQKALDDATKRAQEEREAAQIFPPTAPPEPKVPKYDLSGLATAAEAAEKATIGVRGTFSAMEAARLGVGGAGDRLLAAAEKTEKHTKKVADWTDDAEATFE